MRPDNTARLVTAAKRRHELTRAKAIRALRELDRAGTPVTFETLARTADVSRSWLYTQEPATTSATRPSTRATTDNQPHRHQQPVAQARCDPSLFDNDRSVLTADQQLKRPGQRHRLRRGRPAHSHAPTKNSR